MKQYGVILADPPWEYRNAGGNGAAANHYPTMGVKAICSLPVTRYAANDAILYLWATWPQLTEAMRVISAWGFTYKTGLPWVKVTETTDSDQAMFTPQMGGGFWVRACSELILIATRGKVKPPLPSDRMLGLLGPRLEHSRKPDDVYQLAELHPGPWLEMFARRPREGWDQFGNELDASIDLMGAQTSNSVQTLDDKHKNRGRSRASLNTHLKKQFPHLSSRQSLNNVNHALCVGSEAFALGLVDQEFRDKATGKRLMTKLAELGRLYGSNFFESSQGKQWLVENWQDIVAMTTVEVIARCKAEKAFL